MRKNLMLALVASISVAPPAFALDLNDVLGTLDLGGVTDGLPLVGGGGLALDGLAEVRVLGLDLVTSESAAPLVSANVLDTATDDGQVIAAVAVGGGDFIALDDVLGTVGGLTGGLLGGGDGGSGDLLGGVLGTVGGVTGGLLGGGDGGSGDLLGGVLGTVGGVTGGLLGGGADGSGDLVGGVVGTVGGLVGGLTGGLLN